MQPVRIAAVQLEYAPVMSSATGNLWLPDEPTAVGNDFLAPLASRSVRKLLEWPETESSTAGLLAKNQRVINEQSSLKLKQILDYCLNLECDLVILPEASVLPASVEVLNGYAQSLAIFAGLGRVRDNDLDILAPFGFTDEHVHKNCALFIDRDLTHIVTKRRLANGERADRGQGTYLFQWTRGDRNIGVGLSICKDYLVDDDKLNDSPFPIDVVLVSALSQKTLEFTEKTPRHLRVFSNHAAYGGTTIQIPHLESLGLTDDNGVRPFLGGEQGIAVVDYTDFPHRPTSLQSAQSKLIRRSAVFYDDRNLARPEDPSLTAVSEALSDLNQKQLGSQSTAVFLESAAQVLLRTGNEAMSEALRIIRINQDTGTVTNTELETLTRHIVLTDVRSMSEIRYSQLENAIAIATNALAAGAQTPGLGAYRDELVAAKQSLLRDVRSRYRSASDRSGAVMSSIRPDARGGSVQTFYGSSLGRFSPEEAASSFPLQFDVLRTLSREGDARIDIVYRLVTTRTVTSELVPLFEVTANVDDGQPGEIEQLQEGLGQLLGVAYASAWSVTGLTEAEPNLGWEAELVPPRDWRPLITEDWAPLIDLLRAQEQPVELILTCRALPSPDVQTEPEILSKPSKYYEDRFIDTNERMVGRYLSSLVGPVNQIDEEANLALRFVVGAQSELPSTLLTSIALRLFGSARFTISVPPAADPPNMRLKPSEALRVFHPPYGPLQGRGLLRSEPKFITLPSVPLPSTGSILGSTTLSSARADQDVSIRLDPDSRLRHVYVIGKTGSGKTNLLKNLARQDIQSGAGVAVIDPHGDLVEHLLRHVEGREEEVTLLDFGDPSAVPVLNPIDLDVDPSKGGSQRLAIDDFISLLVRQSYHEWYGPRFEDTVRLTLESLLSSSLTDTPTVLDVSRVLRSKQQRARLTRSLSDPDLLDRWKNFEAQRDNELAELIHWILAKFSDMDRDGVLGAVLGGGRSTMSITGIVQSGGVLLVRIPEWEIGPAASAFIGSLIQERLRRAAFDRISRAVDTPNPFYLYVDEFQKFATSGFEAMLAEARKFGLGLVVAHQNLRQLEEFSRFTGAASPQLLEAILGNVANLVALGLSSRDAGVLSGDFGVEAAALSRVARDTAVVRLELGRGDTKSFSVRVPYAESDPGVPMGTRIRSRMVQSGVWRDRGEVDNYLSMNRLAVEGTPSTALPTHVPFATGPELPEQSNANDLAEQSNANDFASEWLRLRSRQREEEVTLRQQGSPTGDGRTGEGPTEDGPTDESPTGDSGNHASGREGVGQ